MDDIPPGYVLVCDASAIYGISEARIKGAIRSQEIRSIHRGPARSRGSRTWVMSDDVQKRFAVTIRRRHLQSKGMKMCRSCLKELSYPDAFHKDQSRCKDCQREARSKWGQENRERSNAYRREWVKNNPDKAKAARKRWYEKNSGDAWLRHRYGITLAEYDAILDEQGGVCAICGNGPEPRRRLAVDHCHDTGLVRGILCSKCNSGIGQFRDDPSIMEKAIAYLRKAANQEN